MLIPNDKTQSKHYYKTLFSVYCTLLERNWIANQFHAENIVDLQSKYGSLKKADKRNLLLNKTLNSTVNIQITSYKKTIIAREKFDQDNYSIEVHSPQGTKGYTLIIDFHNKTISGDMFTSGQWKAMNPFEFLPLALIVDASYTTKRPFDELFYQENNKLLLENNSPQR